jgi:hypothetical protein
MKCAGPTEFHPEDLSALASWSGKYPAAVRGQEPGTLFDVPAVSDRLHRLLDMNDYVKLTQTYALGGLITNTDGYLTFSRCMPHACPNDAHVAINLKDGSVVTVFNEPTPDYRSTVQRCFASGVALAFMPKPVTDFLLEH